MKRITSLTALVAVGIVIGLLLRGFPVRQVVGGPPLTASQNGDVNGDGLFDITDPVAMLLYLFAGGDEPVASAVGVPTDNTELVLAVDRIANAVETISDRALCDSHYERWFDNRDQTATDSCGGLMWSLEFVDSDGDGGNEPATFEQAEQWISDLTGGGYTDWRMPTFPELRRISWDWQALGREDHWLLPVLGDTWTSSRFPNRPGSLMAVAVLDSGRQLRLDPETNPRKYTLAVRDLTE